MTATKHYVVQSRVRGQWGDLVKYDVRDNAERGLTALRKVIRDQPSKHKYVEGYRLISREYVETVLDPVAAAETVADDVWKEITREPWRLRENEPTWAEVIRKEQERRGKSLTLDELLALARGYRMTPEEIEAQRQSWARQDMD